MTVQTTARISAPKTMLPKLYVNPLQIDLKMGDDTSAPAYLKYQKQHAEDMTNWQKAMQKLTFHKSVNKKNNN